MLRTRLAAMGATDTKNADGSSRDMDTSMSAPVKKYRTMGDTISTGKAPGGEIGNRPRGEALETALAAD